MTGQPTSDTDMVYANREYVEGLENALYVFLLTPPTSKLLQTSDTNAVRQALRALGHEDLVDDGSGPWSGADDVYKVLAAALDRRRTIAAFHSAQRSVPPGVPRPADPYTLLRVKPWGEADHATLTTLAELCKAHEHDEDLVAVAQLVAADGNRRSVGEDGAELELVYAGDGLARLALVCNDNPFCQLQLHTLVNIHRDDTELVDAALEVARTGKPRRLQRGPDTLDVVPATEQSRG